MSKEKYCQYTCSRNLSHFIANFNKMELCTISDPRNKPLSMDLPPTPHQITKTDVGHT